MSMMTAQVIMVIECVRNSPAINYVAVVARGNDPVIEEAEKRFLTCIRENTSLKLDNEDEIDDLLSEGYFEDDDYSVALMWGNLEQ